MHSVPPPAQRTCRTRRILGQFALVLGLLFPAAGFADTVLYRVNVGGPQLPALDAGPAWARDQEIPNHSPYGNPAATGDNMFDSSAPIGPKHASVPAYVPAGVFTHERWDPPTGPEMKWEFPVANGTYAIHLFLAEAYYATQSVGARTMDMVIEGVVHRDEYDIYAHFGGYTPGMESLVAAVTDGSLTIELRHGAVDDPALRGIEIVAVSSAGALGVTPSSIDFGVRMVGTLSPPRDVTVTNLGAPGHPDIQITGLTIAPGFTHNLSPQSLEPGESRTFQVRFQPGAAGPASGNLSIAHNGNNSPVAVTLQGVGVTSVPVGFGKSPLAGTNLLNPTSLQFGADGRLYVAQRDGRIKAHTIQRVGPNAYATTAIESILVIRALPNRNDNGLLNPAVTDRLVTGLLVSGTAANPILYVTSSDPRMNVAGDIDLDTNSGIVSRLQKVAGVWTRTDLVRGLPRSENDHCTNGMALDTLTNTLYVCQGGNANMGAPSLNFSFLPEYALSAAILSVDLDAIGNTTYDLPTLNDETRAGVSDANDPFGGNDGLNQARIVPGGPVQVFSPGWRNPFDVLVHSSGRIYAVDNGPNLGWGGPPVACTNANNDDNSATLEDNLHLVTPGFYAGHPNPTRASTTNTFNGSNPQSPVPAANPVECSYIPPGSDGSLVQWSTSTNGLTEYRATNFGGALTGSLLTVSFANTLTRVALDAEGDAATTVETLFSNIGVTPLDVTAQGDGEIFHGSIWVADYVEGTIVVFEPSDTDGGGAVCSGADDALLDEDGDGYSNADEIDNATNPCSAADVPADSDTDLLSDRNDPDDDNDGTLDPDDAFARDASNGAATTIPLLYTWDGGNPGFGLFTLGFTGLMANGVTDYLDQYAIANLTPGGAAGKLTIDAVPAGDALGTRNNQLYGFQFGVATDSTTAPFTVRTRLSPPWFGGAPVDSQAAGLFIGTGMQSDYVSVSVSAGQGERKLKVRFETGDVPSEQEFAFPGIGGVPGVELGLDVDPAAGTVQPHARLAGSGRENTGGLLTLAAGSGLREAVRTVRPLAIGIVATSRGALPFSATWDYIEVDLMANVDAPAPARPRVTRLLPVVPHPMRGTALVRFELATAGPVTLDLHGLDGRRIRRIAGGMHPAGVHAPRWDGRDEEGRKVAPGVYFARLATAGGSSDAQRIVVLE